MLKRNNYPNNYPIKIIKSATTVAKVLHKVGSCLNKHHINVHKTLVLQHTGSAHSPERVVVLRKRALRNKTCVVCHGSCCGAYRKTKMQEGALKGAVGGAPDVRWKVHRKLCRKLCRKVCRKVCRSVYRKVCRKASRNSAKGSIARSSTRSATRSAAIFAAST